MWRATEAWRQDYKLARSEHQGGRPKARPQCGETMVELLRDSWNYSGRKLHLPTPGAGSGAQTLSLGVQKSSAPLRGGRPGTVEI